MRFQVRLSFLFVCLVGGLAHAAEQGAASGTGATVSRSLETTLAVEDLAEGHQLRQVLGVDRISTTDQIGGVPFDGAESRTFEQSDVTGGSGLVRGYGVWEAKTGEKLYVVYGYTIPPAPPGPAVPFAGSFEWTGGTGPLTNVTGKGSFEGEIDRSGKVSYRWAGSFEHPTPSQPLAPLP